MAYNRQRDVTQPGDTPSAPQTSRQPVNRAEARLFFAQSEAKADETMAILNALGKNFRIPLNRASAGLRAIVRHIDPESKGEYVSWETYKKCVDRSLAASFPDLAAYENEKSGDPQADSDRLRTLMLEQVMALDDHGAQD